MGGSGSAGAVITRNTDAGMTLGGPDAGVGSKTLRTCVWCGKRHREREGQKR